MWQNGQLFKKFKSHFLYNEDLNKMLKKQSEAFVNWLNEEDDDEDKSSSSASGESSGEEEESSDED